MAILRILHAGSSLRREMKGVNAAVFYTPLQAPPPVTSTTTTAATSPVPQATNAVCPAFEAQLYTTGSLQYTIHCGFVPSSYKLLGHSSDGAGSAPYDTPYNDDINGETVDDMESCMDACASVADCNGIYWSTASEVCAYIEVSAGSGFRNLSAYGVDSAVLQVQGGTGT